MSLWTPDGEHEVPPDRQAGGPAPSAEPERELTEEEREQAAAMAKELAEARSRLLETEVSTVLANHAMGIYELAAIHLTADDPDLAEAKLAIDALGALMEGLVGRMGDGEATLTEALHQIRLAYVQRSQGATAEES